MCHFDTSSFHLPCLQDSNTVQVSVFPDCIEAGTVSVVSEVTMAGDQGAGVTPVQLFEQLSHGLLLCLGARVGGLSADIQAPLVADADGVAVVVQAVGPC